MFASDASVFTVADILGELIGDCDTFIRSLRYDNSQERSFTMAVGALLTQFHFGDAKLQHAKRASRPRIFNQGADAVTTSPSS